MLLDLLVEPGYGFTGTVRVVIMPQKRRGARGPRSLAPSCHARTQCLTGKSGEPSPRELMSSSAWT